MRPATGARGPVARVLAVLACLLLLAVTLGLSLGPARIGVGDVWQIVAFRVTGLGDPTHWTASAEAIVWDLRAPRMLLGLCVGGGLALVGVAVQALVRNPLADPYLLGVSSGASVGAVLVIVLGIGFAGQVSIAGGGFAGALGAFLLVYGFARRQGSLQPLRLVLAGVAVGYALFGVTSFLVLQSDNQVETGSVLVWLLGSLAAAQWGDVVIAAGTLAVGGTVLLARARPLNAMMQGDETASSLGVDVDRLRLELFVVSSLITGVMVSLSGAIGFVGLVVPHAVRLLVGSDHRVVLPTSLLAGAAFLGLVDLAARTALQPRELPVGVVTAVIGAPLFLWLMDRRDDLGGPR